MKQEETYNTPPQDTETQTSNSTTANKRKLFSLNRNRKNMAVSQVKQKLLAEFEPVIKRSEKAVQPVKKWMVTNPVITFILMVIIIEHKISLKYKISNKDEDDSTMIPKVSVNTGGVFINCSFRWFDKFYQT